MWTHWRQVYVNPLPTKHPKDLITLHNLDRWDQILVHCKLSTVIMLAGGEEHESEQGWVDFEQRLLANQVDLYSKGKESYVYYRSDLHVCTYLGHCCCVRYSTTTVLEEGWYSVSTCFWQRNYATNIGLMQCYTVHVLCIHKYTQRQVCTHTHTHSSYMTLIGVHEMHGRVHPN